MSACVTVSSSTGGAVVAQRLCLALSLAAASSGPHDVNGVCTHALTLAANGAKSSPIDDASGARLPVRVSQREGLQSLQSS